MWERRGTTTPACSRPCRRARQSWPARRSRCTRSTKRLESPRSTWTSLPATPSLPTILHRAALQRPTDRTTGWDAGPDAGPRSRARSSPSSSEEMRIPSRPCWGSSKSSRWSTRTVDRSTPGPCSWTSGSRAPSWIPVTPSLAGCLGAASSPPTGPRPRSRRLLWHWDRGPSAGSSISRISAGNNSHPRSAARGRRLRHVPDQVDRENPRLYTVMTMFMRTIITGRSDLVLIT